MHVWPPVDALESIARKHCSVLKSFIRAAFKKGLLFPKWLNAHRILDNNNRQRLGPNATRGSDPDPCGLSQTDRYRFECGLEGMRGTQCPVVFWFGLD